MLVRFAPYLVLLLLVCGIAGCDSISKPHDGEQIDTTYKVDYEFRVRKLRPLRDGEVFALWVRQHPDSQWVLASDSKFNNFPIRDSTVIFGRFFPKFHPDSITEAMVTIEFTKQPATPGLPFLKTTVENGVGKLSMAHLGDFSKATGGITFTSKSPDPEAYKKEFYLMNLNNGSPLSSVTMLPQLSGGWRYGLWAADYEFFPYHEFLYGLFDNPIGHDSDSEGDAYPFPGGAKQQPMNVPTGRIIVTLEPPLYGDSLRYKGAELLYILQINRFVQIERDRLYTMANVTNEWLPSGPIIFTRR